MATPNAKTAGSGTYTIVVTDLDTNCVATDDAVIDSPPSALAVSPIIAPITCISGGSVEISAAGGWGSYSYQLEQPDGSIIGPQSNNIFSNLTQTGTYIASVEDANGCEVSNTFNLVTPIPPTASIDAASDYCYDGTNGATLIVTASGGHSLR